MSKTQTIEYKSIENYKFEQHGGWVDLHIIEPVTFKKGEFKILDLGLVMKLPKGYEAIVAARSSTYKKHGLLLVNGIGIIDNEYCGDNDTWKAPMLAFKDVYLPKGTRLLQFRLQKQQGDVKLVENGKMKNPDRGGLGSSGTLIDVETKSPKEDVLKSICKFIGRVCMSTYTYIKNKWNNYRNKKKNPTWPLEKHVAEMTEKLNRLEATLRQKFEK